MKIALGQNFKHLGKLLYVRAYLTYFLVCLVCQGIIAVVILAIVSVG